MLTRGVQREAEAILKNADGSEDERSNAPPGFSDESGDTEVPIRRSGRQTKNKGSIGFGNPVTHSIKLITTNQDITDLNKAALEACRVRLATLKPDVSRPTETKFGLLEKHLFRRKFGSEGLDISKTWNAEWQVPLYVEEKRQSIRVEKRKIRKNHINSNCLTQLN